MHTNKLGGRMTQHVQVEDERKGTAAMFADRRSNDLKASFNSKQQCNVDQMVERVNKAYYNEIYINYGKNIASIKLEGQPKIKDSEWAKCVEERIVKNGYEINVTPQAWIIKMSKAKLNR